MRGDPRRKKMKNRFQYLYGPVYSWRLGMSLGIDPLSQKSKVCNFDCIYCQLGRTADYVTERRQFVSTQALLDEIRLLPRSQAIDHLTFSGRGEPTLASNLGEMIRALRSVRSEEIAVITNSSLLYRTDVQDDLGFADYVLAKLDACSQKTFHRIDLPKGITLKQIVQGITDFRQGFQGKLALQIMFMPENRQYAKEIAEIARRIGADEVQISTPLRRSAVPPLSASELEDIKQYFQDLSAVTVYEKERRNIPAMQTQETIRRHGRCQACCQTCSQKGGELCTQPTL